jgi:hypothetical protein
MELSLVAASLILTTTLPYVRGDIGDACYGDGGSGICLATVNTECKGQQSKRYL